MHTPPLGISHANANVSSEDCCSIFSTSIKKSQYGAPPALDVWHGIWYFLFTGLMDHKNIYLLIDKLFQGNIIRNDAAPEPVHVDMGVVNVDLRVLTPHICHFIYTGISVRLKYFTPKTRYL